MLNPEEMDIEKTEGVLMMFPNEESEEHESTMCDECHIASDTVACVCCNLICRKCYVDWLDKNHKCPMCDASLDHTLMIKLSNPNSFFCPYFSSGCTYFGMRSWVLGHRVICCHGFFQCPCDEVFKTYRLLNEHIEGKRCPILLFKKEYLEGTLSFDKNIWSHPYVQDRLKSQCIQTGGERQYIDDVEHPLSVVYLHRLWDEIESEKSRLGLRNVSQFPANSENFMNPSRLLDMSKVSISSNSIESSSSHVSFPSMSAQSSADHAS